MVGVDIGGYLEDEARELGLVGVHHSLLGLCWLRVGGYLHEAVEQLLYAEVVERGAEEHRGDFCLAVVVHVKLRVNAVHQFEVIAKMLREVLAHVLLQVGRLHVHLYLLRLALLVGGEEIEVVLIDVVHALELHALSYWPRERAHVYVELLLKLVEQVEGVAALTVHLVDEYDDRRVAHAAHLHELPGLCLHAFG